MDYRHTEDFARDMEAAALRARYLREEALDAFFARLGRTLRSAGRAVVRAFAHRRDKFLPEA